MNNSDITIVRMDLNKRYVLMFPPDFQKADVDRLRLSIQLWEDKTIKPFVVLAATIELFQIPDNADAGNQGK